jgi:hypothetical protein
METHALRPYKGTKLKDCSRCTVEVKVQKQHRGLHALIYVSAAVFIAILQLTGWMEPSIRSLHMLQTLIYVAVIVLCARRSVIGYGAGIGIATFWNIGNLFVTTFISNGWTVLIHLIHAGSDPHAELIVAPIAAAAHFVLIGSCLAAFLLRTSKRPYDVVVLVASALGAIFAFFLMIKVFGPQYLHIFWTMLGWIGIHIKDS